MFGLPLLAAVVLFQVALCGAQCPSGWRTHDEGCYLLIQEQYTWFDAQDLCKTAQGQLVEINSADENAFVASLIANTRIQNVWIGLEDFVVESEYRWARSREGIDYSHWKPGEPNDAHGSEDCVEMDVAGGWNDAHCEKAHFCAVCELVYVEDSIIG